MCQQIWKTQQWPQDWKRLVFIPIPKKDNAKECSNYYRIALISHVSKVMLKILQAKLQQYVNCEFPDVQARFIKGRGTRNQIANICWSIKQRKESRKQHLLLLYWLCQSLWPASWEICMQVRKQQLELDMEQQTGSKLGKEWVKAVHCHPAYLNYMESTKWEMLN